VHDTITSSSTSTAPNINVPASIPISSVCISCTTSISTPVSDNISNTYSSTSNATITTAASTGATDLMIQEMKAEKAVTHPLHCFYRDKGKRMGCVVVLTVVLKRYYKLQLDIVTNGYTLQLSSLILVNFKFTYNLIETDAFIQSANVDSSFSDNSSVILDGVGKDYDASIQSMLNTYEPQGDRSKENYRERYYT
jgi:hypothetical protein